MSMDYPYSHQQHLVVTQLVEYLLHRSHFSQRQQCNKLSNYLFITGDSNSVVMVSVVAETNSACEHLRLDSLGHLLKKFPNFREQKVN